METMLTRRKCQACTNADAALSADRVNELLKQVPDWAVVSGELRRTYKFKNYHETMAFVNATAWISHREDHHPDLEVGYNKVTIRYSTHSVGGLTDNDFICAAKIDALLAM